MEFRMWNPLPLTARLLGAAAVGVTAGIHLHLYLAGYSEVAVIGPLFVLNAVGGGLLVLTLLAVPRRWLSLAALAAVGYELSTLVALLLATTRGLFGFQESTLAPLFWPSVAVESAGAIVLLGLAVLASGRRPRIRVGAARRRELATTK